MADKIQIRRDTAANWTSANSLLAQGEEGHELDTSRRKIGDGTTLWNALPYIFETASAPVDSVNGQTGVVVLDKTDIGLSNVDNTSDINKPVSTAQALADTNIQNQVTINNAKVSFPEAPADGQEYVRKDGDWEVATGGGGGVTDHGALTGLADDDHTQYLTETRHDALPSDNPHSVTATQVGLGNVDNTSDVDKPVSTAQGLADTAIQNFSTQRANHTGTQTASTISDFAAQVAIDETTTSLSLSGTVLTYNDEDAGATNLQLNVFGTEAEDFLNTSNTTITTPTLFAVRTFTTASKPTGRYRVGMIVQLEPGSASNNYQFQLRINGTQIGLEMNEEGKDPGSDNRNLRPLVGYFDHTGVATFDIELWASRESGNLVLHGVSSEVWRVS